MMLSPGQEVSRWRTKNCPEFVIWAEMVSVGARFTRLPAGSTQGSQKPPRKL